jgi:hypothetical protein
MAKTGKEIGKCRFFMDELIDMNNLAKEQSFCLNRYEVVLDRYKLAKGISGMTEEQVEKEMQSFCEHAGIIRIQTMFIPTRDTQLRFG